MSSAVSNHKHEVGGKVNLYELHVLSPAVPTFNPQDASAALMRHPPLGEDLMHLAAAMHMLATRMSTRTGRAASTPETTTMQTEAAVLA